MSDLPPANWYPDPEVSGQQRYWDGTQWTEHRAPGAGAAPAAGPAPDPQPPAWGQQPAAAPQGQAYAPAAGGPSNGLAIASLVVAIVSFFLAFIAIGAIGGIVAVVLGIMAMRRASDASGTQGGRGLAIAGIVVGGLSILIGLAVFIVIAFVGTAIEQGSTGFTDFFECVEEEARTGQDLDC